MKRRGAKSSRLTSPPEAPDGARAGTLATSPDPDVVRNVRTVSSFEHGELHRRSTVERMADAVARVAARTPSLLAHALFFGSWLWLNTIGIRGVRAFDPFPFGLLTTIVSLEAIFLSLFILISQSRLSRQAERREHLDLQVNLLTEQESTATLRLLRRLCEHEAVDLRAFDEETRHLEKKTNIQALVAEIDHKLPPGGPA